ncbi:MAG: pilus assembly PilX N-terminal domain-containing protein [Gallionella sp.]
MASSFIRCKVQDARYKVQGYSLAPVQRGFSLISAIFLLVVIAALGTFAVTLSTNQQQSAALDVLGARAYQAARAGIDWGAYQALINKSCALNPSNTPLPTLPNTLANFTVTVGCSPAAASEASATVTMYQLTSTANQGTVATPNYVERQISVTIAQ